MLELNSVSKRYGPLIAVDNLSLTINDGQIVGLLGVNGAGKSTTLNMLTGCIAPGAGSVIVDGYDMISNHRDAKRNIGYLPEVVPLYDEMTVEGYLQFVCKLKEISKSSIASHINELCETVGITQIRKRVIANLSKGLRQRVGIAQAICGNPKYIILDEPTIGLDPLQIIEFRKMILSLAKEHTIIISSHVLSELQMLCNRFVIIHHGRKVYDTEEQSDSGETRTVFLRAKITRNAFLSIEKGLHGIIHSSVSDTGNDDQTCSVKITVKKDNRQFEEELFKALYKMNAVIYELKPCSESLEDIFVQLTR